MPEISTKRVYDPPAEGDGNRVLVDRVWPRGRTRDQLLIDGWMRDLAPSSELRRWFAHDPAKWTEFKKRYFRELDARPDGLEDLLAACREERVTLVFGAQDTSHNNAVALKVYLERHLAQAMEGDGNV